MTDMADINEDISINRAALGAYIDHIAVFDRLEEIKPLSLPVKVDFILSILCEHGTLTIDYDSTSCHLTERSLMVMRPGHTLKSYSASSDFKGHMIVVSTKLLGNTIPALSKVIPCLVQFKDNPAIKLTPEEVAGQTGLRALLRNKTSVKNHPYCDDVVRSLLEAMFYETLGLYSSGKKALRHRAFCSFLCRYAMCDAQAPVGHHKGDKRPHSRRVDRLLRHNRSQDTAAQHRTHHTGSKRQT